MRIIRFPDANKTDIIDASDTIEEVVDKWKCNGNPNLEVIIYAYLPPYFFPSRSDGSAVGPSSARPSQEISHPGTVLEVKESSDTFEEDD